MKTCCANNPRERRTRIVRSTDVGVSLLLLYHDMGRWSGLMPLYFALPVVCSRSALLSRPVRWIQASTLPGPLGAGRTSRMNGCGESYAGDIEGPRLSAWRAALNGAEPVLPTS